MQKVSKNNFISLPFYHMAVLWRECVRACVWVSECVFSWVYELNTMEWEDWGQINLVSQPRWAIFQACDFRKLSLTFSIHNSNSIILKIE